MANTEAPPDAQHIADTFARLPHNVVLSMLLPLLNPCSCLCLAATCRALQQLIYGADEYWKAACSDRGWGPFPRGFTWRQGFCQQQRRLCVACQKPTRYVFPLLGSCRLCDVCEHHDVKYALVTACEALERFGLTPAALVQLPDLAACGTRLYLRSDVAALAARSLGSDAAQLGAGAARCVAAEADSGSDRDGDGGGPPSDGDDSGVDGAGDAGGEEAAAARAAQREAEAAERKMARKANKKQAKSEQRQKREGKSKGGGIAAALASVASDQPAAVGAERFAAATPAASAAPATGASNVRNNGGASASTPVSIPVGRGQGRGGNGQREGGAYGSSPPGSSTGGVSGTSPPWSVGGRQGGSGGGRGFQRDGKKLRHREQQAAAVASGGKTRNQGRLVDDGELPMDGRVLAGSSPKQKSSWLEERERLMAAWGAFGISGLVLSED